MKLKSDFVTNSSSTAYVCCIPKNFIPEDDLISSILEHCCNIDEEFFNYSKNNFEDFKNKLISNINKLKQHGVDIISQDNYDEFFVLKDLLEERGYIVLSVYPFQGGSCADSIFSMSLDNLTNTILEQEGVPIHEVKK